MTDGYLPYGRQTITEEDIAGYVCTTELHLTHNDSRF